MPRQGAATSEDAPASIYGASKLAAEQYLGVIVAGTPMTLSVVQPGNIFGPAQDPHGEAGVVAIFAQRMLRNEPVVIFGDGSQLSRRPAPRWAARQETPAPDRHPTRPDESDR